LLDREPVHHSTCRESIDLLLKEYEVYHSAVGLDEATSSCLSPALSLGENGRLVQRCGKNILGAHDRLRVIVRPSAEHFRPAGLIPRRLSSRILRDMSGPIATRLAEVQLRVEEALAVVERQRMIVLELQRKGEDASEAKRLLLKFTEILILTQEERERIRKEVES